MNFRKEISLWQKHTFKDLIEKVAEENNCLQHGQRAIDFLSHSTVKTNEFLSRKVDGYLVERLAKHKESENFRANFWFTDVFDGLITKNIVSPASYCIEVAYRLNKQIPQQQKIFYSGFMARALRTFASLLREPDFENLLLEILIKEDSFVKSLKGAGKDVFEHTDLHLIFLNQGYRIWQYQSTYWGIEKLMKKLSGTTRGSQPKGLHLLCPVDVYANNGETEDFYGWRLCTTQYCNKVRSMLKINKSKSYDEIKLLLAKPQNFKEFLLFEVP